MSVLTACSICVLKTINFIEVLKYLFGLNGLNYLKLVHVRDVDSLVRLHGDLLDKEELGQAEQDRPDNRGKAENQTCYVVTDI